MKFGRMSTNECEGAILAHSHLVLGKKWRKGKRLDRYDVEILLAQGIEDVVVAKLDESDVDEDTAAESLARVISGTGTQHRAPRTGRCNIYATRRGLLRYDRSWLDEINSVDEAFTFAAVPPYSVVYAGQLLVSIKIIPFAVDREQMNKCITVAGGIPAIRVNEFESMSVALIQTQTEAFNKNLLKKASTLLHKRIEECDSKIVSEDICDHHETAVALSMQYALESKPDLVLILGASAIQDRNDVIPKGITDVGGRLVHFGMPVDPGNLLLLARYGRVPVLGLPGCVRSPKRNGFDFVLERLAAGLDIESQDIACLGSGGILIEGSGRAERRTAVVEKVDTSMKVAAAVLAAGQSRRMGRRNKMTLKLGEHSIVEAVVAELVQAKINHVVVVTGYDAAAVTSVLENYPVKIVHNAEYEHGLSTSLRTAVASLPPEIGGVLVCLGDMPFIKSAYIDTLLETFDPASGRTICVPTYKGKRGNPVLWSRHFFQEMMEVRGDVGAKHLIGDYEQYVTEVEIPDPAVIIDLDTPQAYEQFINEASASKRTAESA